MKPDELTFPRKVELRYRLKKTHFSYDEPEDDYRINFLWRDNVHNLQKHDMILPIPFVRLSVCPILCLNECKNRHILWALCYGIISQPLRALSPLQNSK